MERRIMTHFKGRCKRILSDRDYTESLLHLDSAARHVGAEVNVSCRGKVVKTVSCMPDLKWSDSIPTCLPEDSDNINEFGIVSPCILVIGLLLTFIVSRLHSIRHERRFAERIANRARSSGNTRETLPIYESGRDGNNNPPPYFSVDPITLTPQTDPSITNISLLQSPRTTSSPQVLPLTYSEQTTQRSDQAGSPLNYQDSQIPRHLPDLVSDDRPPTYTVTPTSGERITRFPRILIPDPPAYSVSADLTTVLIDDPALSQSTMQVLSAGTLLTSDIYSSDNTRCHTDGSAASWL